MVTKNNLPKYSGCSVVLACTQVRKLPSILAKVMNFLKSQLILMQRNTLLFSKEGVV